MNCREVARKVLWSLVLGFLTCSLYDSLKMGEDGLGATDRAQVAPLPHSGAGQGSLFCAACRWSGGCWGLLAGTELLSA